MMAPKSLYTSGAAPTLYEFQLALVNTTLPGYETVCERGREEGRTWG